MSKKIYPFSEIVAIPDANLHAEEVPLLPAQVSDSHSGAPMGGGQSRPLQVIKSNRVSGAVSSRDLSARDYSPQFQERVVARFVATQSMKQTARDFAVPARVVSEILHLANFRRPMTVARSAGSAFNVRNAKAVSA